MKILHISSTDCTGAGICAYRIHKSLIKLKIDSKLLVLKKTHDDNTIICRNIYSLTYLIYKIIHRLLRFCGIYICEFDKVIKLSKRYRTTYTLPTSIFDLSKDKLVKEADIIHIHWADNFIDYPSFISKIRKPIIWTLHDENLFYGISHYHDSIITNNPLEIKYSDIKSKMIRENANKLNIVFLSNYFYTKFGHNDIISNIRTFIVNNSVDTDLYSPKEYFLIRNKYSIDDNTILISFIAGKISDPHKGLEILQKAIKKISNKKFKIIAVGDNKEFVANEDTITTGTIKSTNELSEILSASDIFVMPSLQEAFSQAPLEAMACGVPVVAFPVSGTDELINPTNGIKCNGFELDDLISGIKKAINTKYDKEAIRHFVQNNFSPNIIANKYINIYKQTIDSL